MCRLLALLIAFAAILPACVGAAPDHVRLGVVGALSGPRAYLGVEVARGAELAIEDVNADGGLIGEPVELIVRDAADLVDLPGRLAELAERERVSAVIGPDAPGVLLGARSPLARREVPALLPTAFAGDLEAAPAPTWRTVPGARAQAEALGRWFTGARGITELAVLVIDPTEGPLVRDDVAEGLVAGGAEIRAVLAADGGSPDLGPAVARLRRAAGRAGGVVLWGPPPAAARATRAVRRQGWDVQIAVPASSFVGEYRTLAGGASEGVVVPFPFRREWFGPEMEDWLLRWHSRHGIRTLAEVDTLVLDLPVAALAAYDAVGLVAAAVRTAGSREPAEVGAALDGLEHDGLLRRYRLDDREAWSVTDLHVARFHHFAVVYDVDPAMDRAAQRRFYDFQVRLGYVPDELLSGPAGERIRELIAEQRARAPDYEAPLPPPGPVARPETRG